MAVLCHKYSNKGVVHAREEIAWLVLIVVTAITGFYLRFLWAMNEELKHFRRKDPTCRTWQPLVRRNLFRLDPADLWGEKSDCNSSRIKDHF